MSKNSSAVQRYYWDSCVFLSLLDPDAPDQRIGVIEAMLEESDKEKIEIHTSMVSIVEVAFGAAEKAGRQLDSAVEDRIEKLWMPPSPIKLIEFDETIATDARSLMRKAMAASRKLRPMDAIHLATAKRAGVDELHTYDPDFTPFGPDFGAPICKPHIDILYVAQT